MKKIKLKENQILKLNQLLVEDKLRTYIFDWDDNILYMPTKIKMDVLDNGTWIPKDVSTEEYSKIRGNKEYRLRNNNPEDAFEDFRTDSVFLEDVEEAIHNEMFAPSAIKFKEALIYGNNFAINTARGHKPNTIKKGVEIFINMVLTKSEKNTMISNIKKILPKTTKMSDTKVIETYLNDMGEYYPVSSDEFGKEFNIPVVGGAANPEVAKKIAIKDFVQKILNKVGELVDSDKYTKMSVGFSDDDIKNVKAVELFIQTELETLYPNIHFVVYDTSDKGKKKIVIKKEPGVSETINESRVSDGYDKYKQSIDDERRLDNQSAYDYFIGNDFIKETNFKYLPWLLKNWYGNTSDDGYDDLLGLVWNFHSNIQYFDNKDINGHTPESLRRDLVSVLEKKQKKLDSKKIKKLLDDEDYLIIEPLTHESSCIYGGGTKWCTTTKNDDSRFRQYTESGKLLYVIDKNKKETNPLYKIALYYGGGHGKPEIYNAPDKLIKTELENLFPDYVVDIVTKYVYKDIILPIEDKYDVSDKLLSRMLGDGQYMYKGFNVYYDSTSGTIYWNLIDDFGLLSKYNLYEFGVIATPFWDGCNCLPIDVFYQYTNGSWVDGVNGVTINFLDDTFKTENDISDWINNNYFEFVYRKIIYYILPNLDNF
jgi:hypothetical protein